MSRDILWPRPRLLLQGLVDIVGLLGGGILQLLPTWRQRRPNTRPEASNEALPVQPPANEDQLVQFCLLLIPRLVTWAIADCLMDPLENKLLVAIAMDAEDTLASENVLGLLCQEIPHIPANEVGQVSGECG